MSGEWCVVRVSGEGDGEGEGEGEGVASVREAVPTLGHVVRLDDGGRVVGRERSGRRGRGAVDEERS